LIIHSFTWRLFWFNLKFDFTWDPPLNLVTNCFLVVFEERTFSFYSSSISKFFLLDSWIIFYWLYFLSYIRLSFFLEDDIFSNILTFTFKWGLKIILAKNELFTIWEFNLSFLLDSRIDHSLLNHTFGIIINFILFTKVLHILVFLLWGSVRKILVFRLFRIWTILVCITHDLVRHLIMSPAYCLTLAILSMFNQIK